MSESWDSAASSDGDGLSRAVKRGVAWSAAERAGIQFINIGSSIALARLLSPADFGVLGMSRVFTALSTRLLHVGFGSALIRQPQIRDDHLSTLFVLSLLLNSFACVSLIALSPFASRYFDNQQVGAVLRWMSLVFILRAFGAVPYSLLRRRMDFRATAVSNAVDAIVRTLTAVTLGFLGYGVWALVAGELGGSFAARVYLAYRVRWRPSLRVTRSATKDLFTFGAGMSVSATVSYAAENVDNFMVGKFLGMGSLGFYEKSFNLMTLPAAEIAGRLRGVLFPAFARIQHDTGRFRAAFRKSALTVSLVSYPVFVTLAVLGLPLMTLMYGPRWVPAALPFQVLCVCGPFRVLTSISSSAINAAGSVMPEARRRAAVLAMLGPAVWIGLHWGLVGVAAAVATCTIVGFFLVSFNLRRICNVRFTDLVVPQRAAFLAAAAMGAAEYLMLQWARSHHLPDAVVVVTVTCLGGIVYALVLAVIADVATRRLFWELVDDATPLLRRVPWLGNRLART